MTCLVVPVTLVLLGTGCGGQSSDTNAEVVTSPEDAAAFERTISAPPPKQGQAQGTTVVADGNPDAVLKELNRELLKWAMRHQRVPSSFEEFVAGAQLQVPPAPDGMKYEISKDTRIVLVKR